MNPHGYEGPEGTALRMPEIKLYLYETIGRQIEAMGFKFTKSSFHFTRRHRKGYEKFIFTLYRGFPPLYNVQFGLNIRNNQVQQLLKAFPYQQKIGSFMYCSIMVPMGDFVEEQIIKAQVKKWTGLLFDRAANRYVVNGNADDIDHLTRGQVAGFAYKLYNARDLFEAATAMGNLLQEQVLPLAGQLSSINGIDDFFASRPGWSVKSRWPGNIATELVAAKLSGQRDFHKVYYQIIESIDNRIEKEAMSIDYRKIVEELYNYLLTY